MARRLGGWARLSIVLSSLWTVVVGGIFLATQPSPSSTAYRDANVILRGAALPEDAHKSALAAFIASGDVDELQTKLDGMKLSRSVMADLWDLKYAQPKLDYDAMAKQYGGRRVDPPSERGAAPPPPVGADVTSLVRQDRQGESWVDYRLVRGADGRLHRFPADATDLEISDAVQADLRAIESAQKRTHWRNALLMWIVPILLMYALALTIRWVYRGFRRADAP